MKIGIPKERGLRERRVAGTPRNVEMLVELGYEVLVETGAGEASGCGDAVYEEAGGTIVTDAASLWADADIVLKVNPPLHGGEESEVALMREGQLLISMLQPGVNENLVAAIAKQGASAIALDKVPRISRAQKMDVLSSMANIAGYRAVVEAAHTYGRFFGGQITAAGKFPPARVMVIGAGVAGLAAIAAARGLGAEVRAFDVRLACKEQVESLGASFLELEFEADDTGETKGGYAKTMSKEFIDAEMKLFAEQCKEVDIIITTALIPGRPAPLLITEEMVRSMKRGSVIVDLAAANGGNVALTKADEVVNADGITIIGYTDLTSRLSSHASQFFGTNLVHLLRDLGGPDDFELDLEDEVVRKSLAVRRGEILWPPPPDPPKEPPAQPENAPEPVAKRPPHHVEQVPSSGGASRYILGSVAAVVFAVIGAFAPTDFIQHFTVFVLACFVGWQVVWNVTPALHTPLMSVTNAISGIIVVGGILTAASGTVSTAAILGALAILVASINIVGGFLVTERMLHMFRREG